MAMTAREVYDQLVEASDLLMALHGNLESISSEAAFVIGMALGHLSRAKTLVGADLPPDD